MLKYLPIAAAVAVTNLTLIATSTFQAPSALAIIVQDSNAASPAKNRNEKPAHINAEKSEVRAIYQTLTQFYRGLNEGNVDRIVKTATKVSEQEKEYLRNVFAKVKSAGINVNVEVKNIELTSFSEENAMLKVDSISQANKGSARGASVQSSIDIALVKERGQWKISGLKNVAQAIDK